MSFASTHPELVSLKARLREVAALKSAIAILNWDQSTYLPEKAAEARGEQLGHLEKITHDLATAPDIGRLLEKLSSYESSLDPESDDACLIRVTRKDFERDTKVPSEFLAEQSNHRSLSYEVWKKARAENSFALLEDVLAKTVEQSRRYAEYLAGGQKSDAPFSIMDPLVDLADAGFTVATLRPLFASLRERLVPLLDQVTSSRPPDFSCLHQRYPSDQQWAFGEQVIRAIGYDFSRGRQDKTHHPFMTRFASSDVRITTRVKENDLSECLFSTIHEAGHALYELGVDERFDGTPLGEGASSGIHESQSRLWENLVARSLPFWEHFYPKLQAVFPEQLGSTPLAVFHSAINGVKRSLIRTDADELTYNLHVMIRFDLELDLIEGRLSTRDLPEAWNARYKSDLGVTPQTLSEGVLQDVHWFQGHVGGMFQSYTIGNVLSAQLFKTAEKSLPDLAGQFRAGEFSPLRQWLQTHLHRHGRKFEGNDLIRRATGKDLSIDDYLAYLEHKYLNAVAS